MSERDLIWLGMAFWRTPVGLCEMALIEHKRKRIIARGG